MSGIDWANLLTAEEREASDRLLAELPEQIVQQYRAYLDWIYLCYEPEVFQEDQQMKITYRTPNGRLLFELDVSTGKQAFEVVGAIQELFEEPKCGCCDSENIRYAVREHDGNKFYNLRCSDCNAQLDFGQRKDGKGMWIKRTDKDGHALAHRGWYVWRRSGENQENVTQTSGYSQPPRSAGEEPPEGDIPF